MLYEGPHLQDHHHQHCAEDACIMCHQVSKRGNEAAGCEIVPLQRCYEVELVKRLRRARVLPEVQPLS